MYFILFISSFIYGFIPLNSIFIKLFNKNNSNCMDFLSFFSGFTKSLFPYLLWYFNYTNNEYINLSLIFISLIAIHISPFVKQKKQEENIVLYSCLLLYLPLWGITILLILLFFCLLLKNFYNAVKIVNSLTPFILVIGTKNIPIFLFCSLSASLLYFEEIKSC